MGCGSSSTKKLKATENKVVVNPGTFLSATTGSLPKDYQLISTLGSGAFANVKLCSFTPTGQHRAVKYINKAALHSEHLDSKHLLSEVKVLKELDHPNILRCYEIYNDSKYFYVVTEYCEGGELFNKIVERKRFNENDAAHIMMQLLSAVAYCHDKLVIHRDLKPENILLEEKGDALNLKVADFGSSCFLDAAKKLNGVFGSAYYVAPEVLCKEYNEKCDVWSCGVIMFILLTGRPPYPGSDERQILQMVKIKPLQIDPTTLPHLSPQAVNLLQQMLTVDISKRISAKEAVNHPWITSYRNIMSPADLGGTLDSLKEFNASAKLKDAVHMYLATQIISKQDLNTLKLSFQSLDKNADGKISRNELLLEYKKTMSTDEANAAVNRIMDQVDTDGSGDIDYSEFLKACMDYNKYLSMENLQAAFRVFDKDGSGDITAEELRNTLAGGDLQSEEFWRKILSEVDENGDGVIDLKEFIGLMTKHSSQ